MISEKIGNAKGTEIDGQFQIMEKVKKNLNLNSNTNVSKQLLIENRRNLSSN